MAYVPVIDISQIDHPQDRLRLLTNIKDALENVGFMCIVGHGISEEILQRVEAMSRAFFELPLTTKTRLAKKFFNSQNGNVYKGYFPIQEGPTQSSLKEGNVKKAF
jgi:isopenicillin N synthase-like dioxygenase